jgi:hypothetical protein
MTVSFECVYMREVLKEVERAIVGERATATAAGRPVATAYGVQAPLCGPPGKQSLLT